jgi:hypothetical protein
MNCEEFHFIDLLPGRSLVRFGGVDDELSPVLDPTDLAGPDQTTTERENFGIPAS